MFRVSTAWGWFLSIGIASSANCAIAQITPDSSLPRNSTVKLEGNTRTIEGGTQAGRNLFHSFQQFSVPTGSTAFFNNALDIQNIISRVTGGSISNIDGLIRASGTANLFLLNPSGIIFGRGAALNIGGSFLGTTARSVKFADGTEFGVNIPQPISLLTVSVPIGLQYNGAVAPLQVASQARDDNGQVVGLQVKPGKTLALVGGEVQLNGGSLQAANGRIELGGVTGSGTVGLQLNGDNFFLSYPVDLPLANVSLQDASRVDVTSKGAGSIAITALNLDISGNSKVFAGIAPGLTADAPPGDITLNATGNLKINQSQVANIANTDTTGNTGNINISGNVVQLTGGGQLRTRTLGNGDAGNINIQAGEIFITNPAYSFAYPYAGDDQPALDASNYINDDYVDAGHQTGSSGNISLQANGSITLIGEGENRENKVISTYSAYGGKGGGDILLKANNFISLSNANLVSSSFSQDRGAGNILLDGKESVSLTNNSAASAISFGSGNSGNITIKSLGPVTLQTSRLSTNIGSTDPKFPAAQGNAGNINLSGRSVSVKDGAIVTAVSTNSGKPGNVEVNAQEFVELSGTGPLLPPENSRIDNNIYSSLTTSSDEQAQGSAGNININVPAGTLRLLDSANIRSDSKSSFSGGNINVNALVLDLTGGGQIFTTTNSSGNAGNINLNITDRTNISGGNLNFIATQDQASGSILPRSGVFANTSQTSTGNGGDLNITTRQLVVRDGGQLSVSTSGAGKGGNLNVVKADSVQLVGRSADGSVSSGLFAIQETPDGTGDAGNLTINTRELVIRDGAGVFVQSQGTGSAGNLVVNARSIRLDNNSILSANTRSINTDSNKQQATIILRSGDLILSRGSNITTNARGSNVIGGNINIDTDVLAAVENSRISANSVDSRGGNVTISTQGIFLSPDSYITATGANPQSNGTVQINIPEIDPSHSFVILPSIVFDTRALIASSCSAYLQGDSTFVVTGRGGLPPSPDDPLSSDAVWADTRLPTVTPPNYARKRTALLASKPNTVEIVPATGWVLNDKGEITLISSAFNATSIGTTPPCSQH
ncbi:MAG: filamentous hemagglutinin N-terminal domain-containing protein [Rhizonema sp. NSF051]|nr:filamentous hemagglutinin N-terminal domain-containing protein [Rhizonema sp. NSF051]